jgi:hypothetical protein
VDVQAAALLVAKREFNCGEASRMAWRLPVAPKRPQIKIRAPGTNVGAISSDACDSDKGKARRGLNVRGATDLSD